MNDPATPSRVAARVAARAGVGLRPRHYQAILATHPDIGFFEVHAENYMGAGGPPHRYLETIRGDYPLSIHGVGLSIGSSERLAGEHLERLRSVVQRYEPGLVSEHLAWSTHGGCFLNDLLPLPYPCRLQRRARQAWQPAARGRPWIGCARRGLVPVSVCAGPSWSRADSDRMGQQRTGMGCAGR